jgi:hypothetical protein
MNFAEITAALKAKYRPIFRGGIEKEAELFLEFRDSVQEAAKEVTGAGRAIASLTEGKGE